jgi:subtilisin-like proprotein convertase family protein
LQGFVGESLRGIWRLYVRDLLRRDTGRLNRWQLEIEYASVDRVVEVEATPNATIPDADPSGIASAIDIDDMGTVKDVRVSVEIAHTFIGDLRVELIAPSGQRALLHNRAGGGKDDLRITYDIASAPALEGLIGGQIKGVWVLQVQDLQLRDVGTLEKWSLALTY